MPYRGPHSNTVRNGLLLRSDIHTLFDLGKITISNEYKVRLCHRKQLMLYFLEIPKK